MHHCVDWREGAWVQNRKSPPERSLATARTREPNTVTARRRVSVTDHDDVLVYQDTSG